KARGTRSFASTPLMREGTGIGTLVVEMTDVDAFSPRQIALLETFADQAVIAIENVRLFHELEERNGALREALEHQTATAEVLNVIAGAPTDLQPVFDAIAERAMRLCHSTDAILFRHEGDHLTL